jgi:hypothetical protein
MKHLCMCAKSQSFAGAVIQSVFDYLNFLVRYVCHVSLLGHVLQQQAIEALVGASLTTANVYHTAKRFIYPGVPAECFAIVIG